MTDRPVNIIISDDYSDDHDTIQYLKTIDACVLNNKMRLGIAGNTNRILKSARRFRHLFILNDDVEVKDISFINEFISLNLPHVCGHTPNIYGSKSIESLTYMQNKMHGSILYIDTSIISKVGYFDTDFGYYGMEHIDWSRRAAKACGLIGVPVYQSNAIITHPDTSSVHDKKRLLSISREMIRDKNINRYVDSNISVDTCYVKADPKYQQLIQAMDYPEITFTDNGYDFEFLECSPANDNFLRHNLTNTSVLAPLYPMMQSNGFASTNGIPSITHVANIGTPLAVSHASINFLK